MKRKIWQIALAVLLLLYGIIQLTNVQLAFSSVVLGVLSITAAIFLLLDK